VEQVSKSIEIRPGSASFNGLVVLLKEIGNRGGDVFEVTAGSSWRRSPRCFPYDRSIASVEDNARTDDVVAHVTMQKQARPRSIRRQHAPNGALNIAGRLRNEPATVLTKVPIQIAAHDTGLDPDAIRGGIQDGPEMPADVNDEPRAKRFPGKARTRASGHQRQRMFPGVADQGLEVGFVARDRHAERQHLKDAGIGAVEGARQLIEKEISFDETTKVVLNPLALLFVHGLGGLWDELP
jgi:hypothetical protein